MRIGSRIATLIPVYSFPKCLRQVLKFYNANFPLRHGTDLSERYFSNSRNYQHNLDIDYHYFATRQNIFTISTRLKQNVRLLKNDLTYFKAYSSYLLQLSTFTILIGDCFCK